MKIALFGSLKSIEGGTMQRYGMMVRLKPEKYAAYKEAHQIENVWPAILELGAKCNIRNQTIFYRGGWLFRYFEYTGDDYAADMRRFAQHPQSQAWSALMTAMMEPVEGAAAGEWWVAMEELIHTD
jgi:L-rhamnose mutarotase